jgi:altronate hydrolase
MPEAAGAQGAWRGGGDDGKAVTVLIRVHPSDNVAVATAPLEAGDAALGIVACEAIPRGHKIALLDLLAGTQVRKFGAPIGVLTADVAAGAWVHSHNLRTELGADERYVYAPGVAPTPASTGATFMGYRRADGRVGTRNELWVLNTVGCVNRAAERIARDAAARHAGAIDGVHAFGHPYGCSQLGDDLDRTRAVIAGLAQHPNAGGVVLVGLGCENNRLHMLLDTLTPVARSRVRWFNAQDVEDELEAGAAAIDELVALMTQDRREPCPLSALTIGVKCGGSDGLSGLTANALVGRITDRLTADGGTVIQTEVPEMFGAERLLMARAADEAVFDRTVTMVERFKEYFRRHDQPIYENPSPGNKEGGLTTLEEKSLGAVQKGGSAAVTQVLDYGDRASAHGLVLLEAPGNDAVSSTALAVSGATLILFTTGRGTPLGFPVPTMKIASNSALATRKPKWIDFDAGPIAEGADADALTDALMARILATASGQPTRNEENDVREIAIWKGGVTL